MPERAPLQGLVHESTAGCEAPLLPSVCHLRWCPGHAPRCLCAVVVHWAHGRACLCRCACPLLACVRVCVPSVLARVGACVGVCVLARAQTTDPDTSACAGAYPALRRVLAAMSNVSAEGPFGTPVQVLGPGPPDLVRAALGPVRAHILPHPPPTHTHRPHSPRLRCGAAQAQSERSVGGGGQTPSAAGKRAPSATSSWVLPAVLWVLARTRAPAAHSPCLRTPPPPPPPPPARPPCPAFPGECFSRTAWTTTTPRP
jgi:hypothetical protein